MLYLKASIPMRSRPSAPWYYDLVLLVAILPFAVLSGSHSATSAKGRVEIKMIFNLTRLRAAICLFSFSGFLPALNVKTSPDAYWEKSRRNDIPSEMGQLIYNYNLH